MDDLRITLSFAGFLAGKKATRLKGSGLTDQGAFEYMLWRENGHLMGSGMFGGNVDASLREPGGGAHLSLLGGESVEITHQRIHPRSGLTTINHGDVVTTIKDSVSASSRTQYPLALQLSTLTQGLPQEETVVAMKKTKNIWEIQGETRFNGGTRPIALSMARYGKTDWTIINENTGGSSIINIIR